MYSLIAESHLHKERYYIFDHILIVLWITLVCRNKCLTIKDLVTKLLIKVTFTHTQHIYISEDEKLVFP